MIERGDVEAFSRCIAEGGVAIFPADTVYGLACDPQSRTAVERLYALKRRRAGKASAVMFFALEAMLEALPELAPRTSAALCALMPGPVTALVPNPLGRFSPACGRDQSRLGLRLPAWPEPLAMLAGIRAPVMQSSANEAGGEEARRLLEVPARIRSGAALALDGGELPGVASTVIDLCGLETRGVWRVLREGALPRERVETALA